MSLTTPMSISSQLGDAVAHIDYVPPEDTTGLRQCSRCSRWQPLHNYRCDTDHKNGKVYRKRQCQPCRKLYNYLRRHIAQPSALPPHNKVITLADGSEHPVSAIAQSLARRGYIIDPNYRPKGYYYMLTPAETEQLADNLRDEGHPIRHKRQERTDDAV